MAHAHAKAGMPHLFSALIACGLAAAILFAGRMIAIHLEHSTLHSTASELFQVKNQGLAFQRAVAYAPDILPLYGSSELVVRIPDKASKFFRTAPTGFQVSPVGKAGATSMTILQKIAALGSELHGKKLAISLSPEWFFLRSTRRDWYEGNFSLHAASEMAFGTALDFELKRVIALRMLQFPRTLTKSPLLQFALARLASGEWLDRIVFCALWPLGKLQNAVLDLQDHSAALSYVLFHAQSAPPRHSEKLDWSKFIAKVAEPAVADEDKIRKTSSLDEEIAPGRRDAWFLWRMNAGPEWTDFELLLGVLGKIHARPLLLSMPINGQYYDEQGISRSVREDYYEKMRTLALRYNFPLVEFEEHDNDRAFLDSRGTHLTEKGWRFYNRVLDNFFHGRTPET